MMLNNTIVLVDDESNLKSMRHGNNQFAWNPYKIMVINFHCDDEDADSHDYDEFDVDGAPISLESRPSASTDQGILFRCDLLWNLQLLATLTRQDRGSCSGRSFFLCKIRQIPCQKATTQMWLWTPGLPSQILNLGRDDIPPPHRDSKKFTAPSVLDHLPQVSLFFPGYGISTPLHSRVEVQDGRRRYLPAIPIRIYELGTLFTGYHIIWWSTKSM